MNRKVIVFIAMSIDGFIAAPNDDLTFLSMVEKEGEDYGYNQFHESIDTVIVGRKTYDKVLSMNVPFPHSNKECFVITRNKNLNNSSITYYSDSLVDLINTLKQKQGKNIFIDGGAQLVQALMQENLIDEYIVSLIPIVLGAGTMLFKDGAIEQKLKLVNVHSYDTGLVQLHYVKP